jgi:hypothetical protein
MILQMRMGVFDQSDNVVVQGIPLIYHYMAMGALP